MKQLWSHQQRMVNYMLGREYGLIRGGMGTGKTLSALAFAERGEFDRVLVVTKQKAIDDAWVRQWQEHGFADEGRLVMVAPRPNQSVKATANDLQAALILQAQRRFTLVYVVNYDKVYREPLYTLLLTAGWDVMILDESQKAKSHNGSISNALFDIAQRVPRRFCMTGTPMPNGPMDMYGQWRILNPTLVRVHPTRRGFGIFREFYCDLEPVRGAAPGVVKIVGYKNMDRFNRIMVANTLEINRDDVLDLPPEMDVVRHIRLGSDGRKLYKDLNKDYTGEVKAGVITISNVLVKTIRLHQLTGGFAKADQAVEYEWVDSAKFEEVLDLLDSLPPDEPVVIFAKYTAEINLLADGLMKEGYTASIVSGRYNQLKEWQDGKTQIVVVQIDSGAEAIDLTRAHYGIYYSLGYSLGQYEQSRARLNRPGQESDRVWFYHIVATGTIDEAIYKALKAKSDVNATVLNALSEGYREQHSTVPTL